LQPVLAGLGYRLGDFPVAESVTRDIISLPIYPELTDAQVSEVVDSLRRAVLAD
jgi:dTDP-4-amino-4,6-dideoxygalactose transaminase